MILFEQARLGADQPWTLDRSGGRTAGAESHARHTAIATGLRTAGCHVVERPAVADLDDLLAAVHDREYLEYLRTWSGKLGTDDVHIPERSAPGVLQDTPLTAGVFDAAIEAALTAIAAAEAVVRGEHRVYALCRPPGHHAGPGWPGGYCFLNNAALAVETMTRSGCRPGVLDLDYHVGNGTAAILAHRTDARYSSVHASVTDHYPWSEDLPGVRAHFCLSLTAAPSAQEYLDTVGVLVERLLADGVDTLVLSLGYDTVEGDPHGDWNLQPSDLEPVAELVSATALPVCVVQEGGYLIEALPQCAEAFARGLGRTPGKSNRHHNPIGGNR